MNWYICHLVLPFHIDIEEKCGWIIEGMLPPPPPPTLPSLPTPMKYLKEPLFLCFFFLQ